MSQEEKCAVGEHKWTRNNSSDKHGNDRGFIFEKHPKTWCVGHLYKKCEACGFESDEGTVINYD